MRRKDPKRQKNNHEESRSTMRRKITSHESRPTKPATISGMTSHEERRPMKIHELKRSERCYYEEKNIYSIRQYCNTYTEGRSTRKIGYKYVYHRKINFMKKKN
jgi:hypothetical protein